MLLPNLCQIAVLLSSFQQANAGLINRKRDASTTTLSGYRNYNSSLSASQTPLASASASLSSDISASSDISSASAQSYSNDTLKVVTLTKSAKPYTITTTVHKKYTGNTHGTALRTSNGVVYSELISQQTASVKPDLKPSSALAAASSKPESTSYSTSVIQLATTAVVVISTSATTKTHTIYKATHNPTTTDKGVVYTTVTAVSTLQPLVTDAIVTSEVDVTLTRTHFTTDVVISGAPNPTSAASAASSAASSATLAAASAFADSSSSHYSSASAGSSDSSDSSDSSNDSGSSSVVASSGFASASAASSPSASTSSTSSSNSGFSSGFNSSGYTNSSLSNSCLASSINSTSSSSDCFDDTSISGGLFDKISDEAPLSIFDRKQLPLDIPDGVTNDRPYETNKFHANLFLSEQTDMIWSYPYGLFYEKTNMYGWGISYVTRDQAVYGSDSGSSSNGGTDYFTLPASVASLLFSAKDFSSSVTLGVSDIKDFSVKVTLSENNDTSNYVEIPTVLGQGFVTSIYHGDLVPLIKSSSGIKTFSQETSDALQSGTTKYKATLFSGSDWLVYVTSNSSSTVNFTVNDNNQIEASDAADGVVIQVAIAPNSTYEAYYDMTAGIYPTKAKVDGTVDNGVATYGFEYTNVGKSSSGKGLVFALPHHVQSLSSSTQKTATGISLQSTTKGNMYGFVTDKLIMEEQLNTQIQFAPWSQQLNSSSVSWTSDQLKLLASTVKSDLQADIKDSINGISTYSAGKILDKYAYILYVLSDVLEDEDATKSTLSSMKEAFEVFTSNQQHFPFMYDTKFGGISSTANNDGDSGEDYGNGYYNDHHFHYGYFVHAAAIVGYVDNKYGNQTWANDNKDWVNSLIRDVANPSEDDKYFPVSRMFDWFSGHSWAAGLFTSGAGKNEESTSEDYNFSYGMKLWGKVIKDSAMENRGDLMIAVTKRSLNNYFLYSDDNDIEPEKIVNNKVSGIFFENKIAYTTFFGTNVEYIHGIHMIPVTPVSSAIRGPTYVKQEWDEYIENIIDSVDSGWTGILRLNQALYDPKSSYEFFSQDSFKDTWLDNGQSRTWCLAYSGALANGVSSS